MPSEVLYRAPSGPLKAPDGDRGARQKQLTFQQVKKKTTVLQRAALFTYIFILYFAGFIIYPSLIYLAWSRWPILWFLMFEYIFYCCSWGKQASRTANSGWRPLLRRWSFYRVIADYFPIRITKTEELPPGRGPYICCLHPHGIFCFAGFIGFVTNGAGYDDLYPGSVFHGLTLDLSFKTPFLREFHLLHGNCDVSKESFRNILGAGGVVGVVVGGGTESLHSTPGTHRIVLRRRKGFIKQALLSGATLVPGYAFGETDTYRTSNEMAPNSRTRRFQRWMQHTLGFTVPFFHGVGVLLPWGIVPYPIHINVVLGGAVPVPKFKGDTHSAQFHALVDRYHAQYTAALTKLFDDHKEKYAPGATLEIVE